MEHIIFLYAFFTGCVYTSWMWELDLKTDIWIKVFNVIYGFVLGWLVTPVLIGRAIKQIYKG